MTDHDPYLDVRDLHVRYPDGAHAVRGVSFTVGRGETVALVGESGCGKTTIANAVIGGLPRGSVVDGEVHFVAADGERVDLLALDAGARRALRGRRIGYVPQNPFGACDPLRRVGHHVESSWRVHALRPRPGEVATLVERLGVPDAAQRLRGRPHTWSGGMLQRASIAGASALAPSLVLADEPTSALDRPVAWALVDLLRQLRASGLGILWVTHDLSLLPGTVDEVLVLADGEVVERGATEQVLGAPQHPITRALRAAVPRLPA